MSSPVMVPSPPPAGAQIAEVRQLARWQRKLLPFMTSFLVVIAVAFFALSAYNIYQLRQFIGTAADSTADAGIQQILHNNSQLQNASSTELIQRSLLLLEADAMQKRYRQASALLMSRIWTRQLAFITGMVLAFIGSIFILGKMSETKSDVSLGAEQWKGAISSTSPGLILAFFGTVLMAISLMVQGEIQVQDRPLYFTTMGMVQNPKALAPAAAKGQSDADSGAIDPFDDAPAAKASPTPK